MKLRIAYVSPGYPPSLGGVETHVHELAKRVASSGWTVEVLTQDASTSTAEVELVEGVTVRRFENRSPVAPYRLAPSLVRFLLRHGRRYDVVHAQNYHALPSFAAALAGCRRLVFTPHYLGVGETPGTRALHALYRPFGSAVFARARQIVCVTETEANEVRRRFPATRGRITVIPNGIDVPAIRAAVPAAAHGTAVVSAGRLEAYKNVDLAIRALPHLPDDFALYVAGDGPDRSRLAAVAAACGVDGRVTFLGHLEPAALYRWYRAAAVYVSISRRECFGITLLEAAAAGAAVVAADTPVNREVLAAAGVGAPRLVPAGAGAAVIAAAIAAQANTRRVSREPATWDAVAERTLGLYRDMLRRVEAA